jgi:hypothetical protein
LSFLVLLQDDTAIEALFIRACAGNRLVYEYYCECASVDTPDPVLTRWERFAIWKYSSVQSYSYRAINEGLRSGSPSDDVQAVAHVMIAGLKKLPRHAGFVYRGIRVADLGSFLRGYQPGAEVEWRAFSSASLDQTKVQIGNVLFIIRSNNGRVVGPYAEHQDEQEVIFLPGSRFRVNGVERTSNKAIIDLSELPL